MVRLPSLASLLVLSLLLTACPRGENAKSKETALPSAASSPSPGSAKSPTPAAAATSLATFGGGCFWCADAIFRRLDGVVSVSSGFSGGKTKNPTYKQVCTTDTGHAEVIQVRYDSKKVTYEQLLEVFFKTHDPTTKDKQGNDEGPQYRSIVLWHDEEQRKTAESLKKDLDASGAFPAPIVTQIVPYETFWPADDYHQDYFAENPGQPYCQYVIGPKVEKFEKVFKDRLKH